MSVLTHALRVGVGVGLPSATTSSGSYLPTSGVPGVAAVLQLLGVCGGRLFALRASGFMYAELTGGGTTGLEEALVGVRGGIGVSGNFR